MVKARLPLLRLSPPQARINLKSSMVPITRTWVLHQLTLNQIRKFCRSRGLQKSHQTWFTATLLSVASCIFVQVCMHARAGVHVNEKKKRKVEKGLRRQQLAWELRGHGAGIDFINRLSQHSGSGCTDTECGTETDGTNERAKHVCIISFWQQKSFTSSKKRKHTDWTLLWPADLVRFWRWMSRLNVVFLNCRVKSSKGHACEHTAINLSPLGAIPNCRQCRVIRSHLFG